MLYVIFSLLIIGADQLSKALVVAHIPRESIVPVWGGVFHLTYRQNSGMAWSLLEGGRWFFVVVTILAFAALFYILKKKWITHPTGYAAVAMIAGGALGNFIDRIRMGYVVDMIAVEFMDFPVFNVADSFIVCGGILLAVFVLFFDKPAGKEPDHDPAD